MSGSGKTSKTAKSKDKVSKSKKSSGKADGVKVTLPSIRPEEITIQKRLGEGAYGEVFKGICRQTTVAVKYIKEEKYDQDALIAELTIMFQATSSNVVKVLGVLMDEKDRAIGIVTEFLDGGDLEVLLHPDEGPPNVIPLDTKISYALDICLGMSWLMGKDVKIIHRDLKPANIMLDKDRRICKICDFGLAVSNERKAKGKSEHIGDVKSTRGSPLWMAPERVVMKVLADDQLRTDLFHELSSYTKLVKVDKLTANSSEKSDVYSFGIMLWEIATQQWPFVDMLETDDFDELFGLILDGERPSLDEVEPSIAAIIERCWHHDPAMRPTFTQCITLLRGVRISLALPTSVCPQAALFWKKSFVDEHQMTTTIGQFVQGLNYQSFLRPQKSTDSHLRIDMIERCIAALLRPPGQSLLTADKAHVYSFSIADFAKLLKWFGPLTGNGTSTFHNMVSTMKQPWFFGPVERQQCERDIDKDGLFVVRLNTGGSSPIETCPLVISTQVRSAPFHMRISGQTYGKWICTGPPPESKRLSAEGLDNLILLLQKEGIIKTAVPKPPYANLFVASASPDGVYSADPTFEEDSS